MKGATPPEGVAPKHGDERNRGLESEWTTTGTLTGHGLAQTVSERFCGHCSTWVPIRGITGSSGALAWMVNHEEGDCGSSLESGV